MTYRSQGRTLTEVIVAVTFVGFLTGFVAVLCIGNYFRAKRAQERQRQQRLARLAGGSGLFDSPRSHYSGSSSDQKSSEASEQQHLLSGGRRGSKPHVNVNQPSRRRHADEGTDSLLLQVHEPPIRAMHV
jgi:type II secretory pathway pseudopilin PulG